jgi:hypothetical protein
VVSTIVDDYLAPVEIKILDAVPGRLAARQGIWKITREHAFFVEADLKQPGPPGGHIHEWQ